MALQIIVGCGIVPGEATMPVSRVVPNGGPHHLDVAWSDAHDLDTMPMRDDDHPTTEYHSPFWPWACWLGPERNDDGLGSGVIDHHSECRACVLAMGVAAVNRPWCDTPLVENMRKWYDHHRRAHQLPPLPEGR